MRNVYEFMPGVCVIEPSPGPVDHEKVERNIAELKVILENARLRLSQEEEAAV